MNGDKPVGLVPENSLDELTQEHISIIATRIRSMRMARGVTITELAQQAGFSKSTLSTIEAGTANPTIETLSAVAQALRLPLGDLLVPSDGPSPTVSHRSSEGSLMSSDSYKQERLQRIVGNMAVETWRLRLRGIGQKIESPPHSAGTIEHIFVASGELSLGPVSSPQRGAQGDFIVFCADVSHFYEAISSEVDTVLTMTYPTVGDSMTE
ncbi:helix-turn-helix domain-containing protein [Actinopolyspora mzabensis]|uniref:helix-turn-helix domain-containing protein n=1 Tax=Actinopolyspora mzabensis TaxID=995066 RepID=UPI001C40BA3A|nr:XRE family transcriptional regulator [Actinopolyspora mzabensis]